MKTTQIVGLILLVAGIAALALGGFSYARKTHEVDVGPMHLQLQEKKHIDVPVWAGAGAIVLGVVLLVRRR